MHQVQHRTILRTLVAIESAKFVKFLMLKYLGQHGSWNWTSDRGLVLLAPPFTVLSMELKDIRTCFDRIPLTTAFTFIDTLSSKTIWNKQCRAGHEPHGKVLVCSLVYHRCATCSLA